MHRISLTIDKDLYEQARAFGFLEKKSGTTAGSLAAWASALRTMLFMKSYPAWNFYPDYYLSMDSIRLNAPGKPGRL